MKRILSLFLAALLALNTAALCAAETQIGYINEDTKVYMDASEKAIVDGSAALGMQVRIEDETVSEGTGWYKVTFLASNKTGWVKADDVDLVIAKKAITASAQSPAVQGGVRPVERESDFPVLNASGIVDPSTLPQGSASLQYRDLSVGDSGEDVLAVSERLFELGYLDAKYAKRITKAHQSAIKQFQKANKLEQDGLCTAELQEKLFSASAVGKGGKKAAAKDPLMLSKGSVKPAKKGGGTISFNIKNETGEKIDAFNMTMRLYNTYGERFLFSSVVSDITIAEELTALDHAEERYSLKKNETAKFGFELGSYYFAGVMVAITAYHTEDGDTVRIPEDQRHWYGFGKGVDKDYQPLLVTPLTTEERRLAAQWNSGIESIYVDDEVAKSYGVREGYMIQKMEPGSMLDTAGLKAGDILMAIGDVRIFGTTSIDRALARLNPGQSVTVLFLRNGVVYQTQMAAPGGSEAA